MALLGRLEEGERLQRLVLVAAAYQAYYYERIFAEWARDHPRLMFATVKLGGGGGPQPIFEDPELTYQLFGNDKVSGCHFVSVIGDASARPFSGEDRSGAEVRTALLNRYALAMTHGEVPAKESNALDLSLEVTPGAAFEQLCARFASVPERACLTLEVRMGQAQPLEDAGADVGTRLDMMQAEKPMPRRRMRRKVPDPTSDAGLASRARGLRISSRPEQWRSVAWILEREATSVLLGGEEHSNAELGKENYKK